MTFVEAAIEILKQNNNQFMKSREIWKRISEQNLVKTEGKTPWASLNTILIFHSKPEYKKTLYFNISNDKPTKFNIRNLDILSSEIEISEFNIDSEVDKALIYQITDEKIGWKKLSIYNKNNNLEYLLEECEEYTYVLEDKAHATIKIGKTKNDPNHRLNQLRTGNPSLTKLHVFPSSQYSEYELHQKFNDFQKDLEWFFYTKGLKSFITEELSKHDAIMNSFLKKKELEELETIMIELI